MALKLRICKWRYPWQNISFSHLKSKISLLCFFPTLLEEVVVMGSKNDIIALKLFILDLSRVVGVHFKRKQVIWCRAHIFFLNVVTIDNSFPLSKWRSTFLSSFWRQQKCKQWWNVYDSWRFFLLDKTISYSIDISD